MTPTPEERRETTVTIDLLPGLTDRPWKRWCLYGYAWGLLLSIAWGIIDVAA